MGEELEKEECVQLFLCSGVIRVIGTDSNPGYAISKNFWAHFTQHIGSASFFQSS